MTQRTITLEPGPETRRERLLRVLSGELGHHVRPAAELTFTAEAAAEAERLAQAGRPEMRWPGPEGGRLTITGGSSRPFRAPGRCT